MGKHVNIAVGIATGESMWFPKFGLSLASMCSYFGMNRIAGSDSQRLTIAARHGSMLSQQRIDVVVTAKKAGCTHILFLDTDMRFPRDVIHRLLAHNKEAVVANCVIKEIPTQPTAIGMDGKRVYTDPDSKGLEQVWRIGVAVGLIKLSIFDRLDPPWFYQEWTPEIQHFKGEDVYFCNKLRARNIPIYIDHDLSKQVYHIGPFDYGHEVVGEKVLEPVEDTGLKEVKNA